MDCPSNELGPIAPPPKDWRHLNEITGGTSNVSDDELVKGRIDREYHFKERGPCGRAGCKTLHGWGCVWAIPGRRYVAIGHDCRDHLSAEIEEKYSEFAARQRAEAKARSYADLLETAKAKQEWHRDLEGTAKRWSSLRTSFQREFQGAIVSEIEQRAAKLNTRVELQRSVSRRAMEAERVRVVGGRVDVVDANVRVSKFEIVHLGDLRGLSIFVPLQDPLSAWHSLRLLINAVLAVQVEVANADLDKWLTKATRDFGPKSNDLTASLAAAEAFFTDANLALITKTLSARNQGLERISVIDDAVRGFYKH